MLEEVVHGCPLFLLQKNALANGNLAAKLLIVAAYSNCMCELRSRSHELGGDLPPWLPFKVPLPAEWQK